MGIIFQIKYRDIFAQILLYLRARDLCNLKLLIKSEALDKIYAKFKKRYLKKANVILINTKIVFYRNFHLCVDENELYKIENYTKYTSLEFTKTKYMYEEYNIGFDFYTFKDYNKKKNYYKFKDNFNNNIKSIVNYVNIECNSIKYCSLLNFLDHNIKIFKELNIKRGDIVCFKVKYNDIGYICKYLYTGNNFIKTKNDDLIKNMRTINRKINYWEHILLNI